MSEISDKYSQMNLSIKFLSSEEKQLLAKRISASEIDMIFTTMKNVIAEEAKSRIQSKIALTFNHGYGTGQLFNSIYYTIEDDSITVSSTKNYFSILNAGIKSFDMKKALAGKRIKMRLPGGGTIYRTVGNPNQGSDPSKKNKNPTKTGGWIYPGYRGAHIYEEVESEMQLWMSSYISSIVEGLINRAKAREEDVFEMSQLGKQYYNARNKAGQFKSSEGSNSTLSKLIKQDAAKMKQNQLGIIGVYSPISPITGKMTNE